MSGSVAKAPFKLQDVRDAILANEWVCYNPQNDPGTLWVWGRNNFGQLGQNNTITTSSPVQVPGTTWVEVSGGRCHSLARKLDGTLWSWGYNGSGSSATGGQLGDNTTINRSSPVQIPGTSWVESAAGSGHSLARKSDGTLWSWGYGGALGDNTTITKSSPIQVPGTSWVDVAGSPFGSLARKSDGTLWSWGFNDGTSGLLGDGTTINRSSPVQVPGTSWVDISASAVAHSLARKSDGTLWVWGNNYCGALGDNTTISKSSPIQVPGTSWVEIVAMGALCTAAGGTSSSNRSFARKSDGTLWAWGANFAGVLGDNTTISKSSPIQVPGTSWAEVGGSGCQSLARKSDGTLWSWGRNSYGQLGDDTTQPKSSPVQIPGTSWIDIASVTFLGHQSLARKSN